MIYPKFVLHKYHLSKNSLSFSYKIEAWWFHFEWKAYIHEGSLLHELNIYISYTDSLVIWKDLVIDYWCKWRQIYALCFPEVELIPTIQGSGLYFLIWYTFFLWNNNVHNGLFYFRNNYISKAISSATKQDSSSIPCSVNPKLGYFSSYWGDIIAMIVQNMHKREGFFWVILPIGPTVWSV